jgi:hypothetical protein
MLGFGVAVISSNNLSYVSSSDGATWNVADPVVGEGSGGWFPSLAFDPVNHEPAIAYYNCSRRAGVNEASCPTDEDELHIRQRIGSEWRDTVVDVNGGVIPKLGFFGDGKRVVAYRVPPALDGTGTVTPNAGALKLAIEQ